MKKRRTVVMLMAAMLQAQTAWARPVSYAGGWTVMQMHNRENTSIHLHYSPTAKYSVGIRGFHARRDDVFAAVFQTNLLLKRVNRPGSQANFYLKSAAGSAFDKNTASPAAFAGIAADWETRRLFARYENRIRTVGTFGDSFSQSARIGVAPYLADFGFLHTWIMVEAAHYRGTDKRNDTEITPLLRFFKGLSLFEVGYSIGGKLTLNFIRRF